MAATAFLDEIDVEHITAKAKNVSFGKTILRLIAFTLFGLGWIIAKTFAYLWLAMVWIAVAFGEGWNAARKDIATARRE